MESSQTYFILFSIFFIKCLQANICWDPICYFTLEVDRNQNLVYKEPTTGQIFDVEFINGRWVTVETPIKPAFIYGSLIGIVVDPADIITTDGIKRSLFTVNGQFPGPTIEVGYPSQIVVTVVNKLLDETITIHWHGQSQRGTPWMDGVDFLTQCPIQPLHNFTYRFRPDPPGTFWYHTHVAAQIADGIKGMFIIHERLPTLTYFPVLVSDWWHYPNNENAATNPTKGSGGNVWSITVPRTIDGTVETPVVWTSGLINGRGRFNLADTFLPLTVFTVTRGNTHLFRVANGAAEYNFEISVDSHKLRVVALDGMVVDPQVVDAVLLPIGGRADFELVADQTIGNYWMRGRTLKDLQADPVPQEVKAIVSYTGAPDGDPTTSFRTCTATSRCNVIGCALLRYPASYYTDCVDRAQVTHTYTPGEREKYGLNQESPDIEIFLNIRIDFTVARLSFNSLDFIRPTAPVYQTDSHSESCTSCPDDSSCLCTHTISIPKGKVVQIVISNFNLAGAGIGQHPIHIHGQHFALLKNGFSDYKDYAVGDPIDAIAQTPHTDVNCTDGLICRYPRWTSGRQPSNLNLINPPLLDTNGVASSGYFVMRFRSDNPGPWLLHCHNNHHAYPLGHLKVLLDVGRFYYPPLPPKFPVCQAEFAQGDQEFRHYYRDSLDAIRNGGKYRLVQVPTNQRPPHHSFPRRFPRPASSDKLWDKRDKGAVEIREFIGWVVGSFFLGFCMAGILSILVICGCCPCHRNNSRTLESTNETHPSFTNHGNKLFHVNPSFTNS